MQHTRRVELLDDVPNIGRTGVIVEAPSILTSMWCLTELARPAQPGCGPTIVIDSNAALRILQELGGFIDRPDSDAV